EDSGDYETAKKIHGLMKPVDESEDPMEDEVDPRSEEKDGEETDARDTASAGKGKGGEEKKAAEESRKRRRQSSNPHLRELQEEIDELRMDKAKAELQLHIRQLCEARELPCDERLLESCLILSDRKKITAHLDWLKAQGVRSRPA